VIIVFAGAGASKAVRVAGFPTTKEFFDRLPNQIKENKLFAQAGKYLQDAQGLTELDVEQVLWVARDLREVMSRVNDHSTVLGWFLAKQRLPQVLARRDDLAPFQQVAHQATSQTDALVSRINEVVYDMYADQPTEDELSENWLLLLKGICKHNESLDIVTTNYDGVFRQSCGWRIWTPRPSTAGNGSREGGDGACGWKPERVHTSYVVLPGAPVDRCVGTWAYRPCPRRPWASFAHPHETLKRPMMLFSRRRSGSRMCQY
jgi:hypothetical protein